jgi:Ca-activated chloride channel family protein
VKLHSVLIAAIAGTLCGITAAGQQPQETAPISAAIVLDTSGSMGFKLRRMREVVSELARSSNSLDEFTFVQASDRPVALSGFTSPSDAVQTIAFGQPKGRSALLDGIYLGAQLTKTARNSRRILLVISDGEDNASRYTEAQIRNALSEAGVRVYTVGLNNSTQEPGLLLRIAERSGGRHFGIEDASRVTQTVLELSAAMRAQP